MKQSIKRKVVFLVAMLMLLVIAMVITGCEEEDSNKSIYDTSKIKVEQPTSDFYVNDFANIISDENKTKMQDRAVELDKEYDGIQVVVTTVKSLNNYTVDEYAHAMYNQYGIGKDDMGALILLSTGERQIRLETGGKMDAYIPGSVSGRLIDENALSYLKEDKFDEGLENLQKALIEYIKEKVPNEQTDASSTNDAENATVKNAVVTQAKKDTTSQSEKSDNNKTAKASSTETDNSSNTTVKTAKATSTVTNKSENEDTENSSQDLLYLIMIGILLICVIIQIYQRRKLLGKIESYKNKDSERRSTIKSLQREADNLQDERDREVEGVIKNYEKQMSDQKTSLMDEIAKRDKNLSVVKKQSEKLQEQLFTSQKTLDRARTLHPDLDSEILEMIESEYKASAQEIDKKIAETLRKKANKDSISEFEFAIKLYDSAKPDVQKYITGDVEKLASLYTQSVELKREFDRREKEAKDKKKASEAIRIMQSLVNLETDIFHDNYENFSRAKAVYGSLTENQRKYFPDPAWLDSFNESFALVEKDYKIYTSAKQKEKEINKIISRAFKAEEDDLNRIDSALMIYKSLNEEEKRFVPENLFAKLKKMKHAAEDDHEDKERKRRKRREEEEERRRRASYSSNSHSHHSSSGFGGSHYGGHGGISHGGGAHRGF